MISSPKRQSFSPRKTWCKAALVAAGIAASLVSTGISPVYAQRTAQFDLDSAICNNEWSKAIDIISPLVASDTTSRRDRTNLLALRHQLTQYRAENTLVARAEACDRTDPYVLNAPAPSTVQTGEPLGWEGAVAAATQNQYSSRLITESVPFALPIEVGGVAGLTPAIPVDLERGLNVVSGQVGTGHQVYSFIAGLGDQLTASLSDIRVMTGTLYTSDDSQLFLFDRQGKLIAAADDESGQQSRISDFVIPKTDVYFAVVTTYNNDPILNRAGKLTGWQNNGGGLFDYTLTLSGATRTSALVRE